MKTGLLAIAIASVLVLGCKSATAAECKYGTYEQKAAEFTQADAKSIKVYADPAEIAAIKKWVVDRAKAANQPVDPAELGFDRAEVYTKPGEQGVFILLTREGCFYNVVPLPSVYYDDMALYVGKQLGTPA